MASGFIGQELHAAPSNDPSTPPPSTTAAPPETNTAYSQTDPSTTYIPLEHLVSEVDAVHNTILVGLLVALVAASVALGGLAIYCFRRRAQKKTQREYQDELADLQKKADEERAERAA